MAMSEEATTVIINFILGFFFGALPFLLILKGLAISAVRARLTGGYLLRVHMPDGISIRWRVGKFISGSGLSYKIGKEDFLSTVDSGVVKRSLGINWIDVDHTQTAPFNFRKIAPAVTEEEQPVFDDKGNPVKSEETGEYLTRKVKFTSWIDFIGYDDSPAVMTVLRTALMQPRKGLALGNIDFKKVLIVGGIIAIAIYVVVSMKGNGGAPII